MFYGPLLIPSSINELTQNPSQQSLCRTVLGQIYFFIYTKSQPLIKPKHNPLSTADNLEYSGKILYPVDDTRRPYIMMKVFYLSPIFLFLALYSAELSACTIFHASNECGDVLIGRNFDWDAPK